ncbi:hypothetical protein BH708_03925 [Brachybacterium sp. P6-10-X1]|uniref:hypothetical protein n=1 Tax=Brachybacterium sp. P6-10-X1 TaxID=1903186 RepID=UPI000971A846|nr:hypothetical protein [Brachybacterium sp. P6-10-X1]APX32017.1 hypothetical protein BH708_03925 [Brachybacterium sp. P6-10-X1]
MNTLNSRTEVILATHHAALVDVAEGVGVGLHCAPEDLTLEAIEDWWRSRHLLDVELRILGLAVVELLDGGRYVIGRAPWGPEDWEDDVPLDGGPAVPLWEEHERPAYGVGLLEVDGHPALPRLWEELDGVLELA